MCNLFYRFGSEELKQEFLKPSISGDIVSCIGVSEVHCGSDVASKKKKILIYFFVVLLFSRIFLTWPVLCN